MKTTLTFKFQTEGGMAAMYVVMAFLGAFLIAMLSTRSTVGVAFVMKSWILVTCLLLLVMGGQLSRTIVNGARVLRQQRTPQQLWHGWLRASLMGTTRILGFMALAASAVLLFPQSPWPWSSAAALFSATLSLSTVAALSNAGALHRVWAWGITVGGMLLLSLVAMTTGLDEGLNQLSQAPFIVHALMAISWPLLAHFLLEKFQNNPPHSGASPSKRSTGLGARIANYTRRFTPLLPSGKNRTLSAQAQHSPSTQLLLTSSQGFLFPLMSLPYMGIPWHGDIHPYHLLGMAFISLYGVNCLICKDLHWRRLLTPGGLYQGRLGYRIFSTTIAFQMAGALLWVASGIIIARAALDIPLARSLEVVWSHRAVPLAWMFAVSLVSVLRALGAGSTRATVVVFTTYGLSLLALGAASYGVFGLSKGPALFQVDGSFVTALLLATFAMVLLSNRLWTVKKLQPYLRLG